MEETVKEYKVFDANRADIIKILNKLIVIYGTGVIRSSYMKSFMYCPKEN